jgi:hypothetical protein
MINDELKQDSLVACSDGAYDKGEGIASHGWVFASQAVEIVQASGAGPADGHSKLLSSYRAELGGLLTVIYLTYRISQYYQTPAGTMKVTVTTKGHYEISLK